MSAKWLDQTFLLADRYPKEGERRIAFVLMYFTHLCADVAFGRVDYPLTCRHGVRDVPVVTEMAQDTPSH
jgi:hypothetical protein